MDKQSNINYSFQHCLVDDFNYQELLLLIKQANIKQFSCLLNNFANLLNDVQLSHLEKAVNEDGRKGIIKEYQKLIKFKNEKDKETKRINELYDYQMRVAGVSHKYILGIDEVGRGPLAGPLTVGGVILDSNTKILHLNDSKQISPKNREIAAKQIKQCAICYKTFSIPAGYIDKYGISYCLKQAFTSLLNLFENDGFEIKVILLDGNPLNFDKRELNIIKGDAKCASISAASIIAKVTRDSYMEKISTKYPQYNFAKNKGYGTKEHIDAIKKYGLSPMHRVSFCNTFMQMSIFN